MRSVARQGGEHGYALLSALLIISIALLSSATLVAAVLSSTTIATDDAASARAADAADAGVADALDRLRWGWCSLDPAASPVSLGHVPYAGGSYTATVTMLPDERSTALLDGASPVGADDPAVIACSIDASGVWGQARRAVHVVALATPDGLPRGLVVGDEATLEAPTTLQGCGLYAGGNVGGREWLTVVPPPAAQPAAGAPDLAYGGLYPLAGAHADGQICARGVDEHAGSGAPASDTDADSGVAPPAGVVAAPTGAVIGELAAHASDATAALGPSGLDLALLDRAAPPLFGEPSLPAGGRVYVVPAAPSTPLELFGSRETAPQACPATLLVLGDCVACAGPNGQDPPTLSGALIVTGTLTVDAPLCLDGSLYAGRLIVRAPLTVRFAATAGSSSPPGATNVRIASWRQ